MKCTDITALSIDVGGSKIAGAIYGDDETPVGYRRMVLDHPPDPGTIERFTESFLSGAEGVEGSPIPDVIGIAIPGLADTELGEWVYSPFGGTRDVPIAARLRDRFGLPVYIDNDVNLCALAEHRFGVCRGENDFLWITLSNGVGGGLFLDGKLYRGAFGFSGEIGHLVVEPGGRRSDTPIPGTLEAYASGRGIAVDYRDRTKSSDPVSARDIAVRARSGDMGALAAYQNAGRAAGRAIAAAINLLNLPLVVIGGGVAESFDLFEGELKATMMEELFREANRSPRVVQSAFPLRAASIGASVFALDSYEKEHTRGN